MTNFERAIRFTLDREGDVFVNNPSDRGGPTKYGVTLSTLSTFRNTICTSEDVENLTEAEATKIFAAFFWNSARLERVKDGNVALILFDFAVNAGPGTAIKTLQRVLNESFGENLKVDGAFGNQTFAALSTAREDRLIRRLIQAFQRHYVRICEFNPKQIVFLEGWLNRTHCLWETTL